MAQTRVTKRRKPFLTAPKTHKTTRNGSTFEISDADFKRLEKTGKARVTDLRTGEIRVAEVTRWKVA